VFRKTLYTSERQRLLQYGVVIQALIDSLDPEHVVTSDRPSYPDKLTMRTLRDLGYRVFKVYLTFVADKQKFIRPKKRPTAKRNGDPR
jgi:hypothetical protein